MPSVDATAVTSTAYQRDDRVATNTRASTSRPRASVPARCSLLGPSSIAAVSMVVAASPQISRPKVAKKTSTTSPARPARPLEVPSSRRVR